MGRSAAFGITMWMSGVLVGVGLMDGSFPITAGGIGIWACMLLYYRRFIRKTDT